MTECIITCYIVWCGLSGLKWGKMGEQGAKNWHGSFLGLWIEAKYTPKTSLNEDNDNDLGNHYRFSDNESINIWINSYINNRTQYLSVF